jgi:peptidoglycan/LPS O-acetylase OafA/YrhL
MAGVGVNLFLFLSGFGLTASQLQKNLRVIEFYKKRLLKLFAPLWLSLIVFLLLDFFLLKISYSWEYIAKAFVGIFTHANLYQDINSPLWYFTFILGYYLLFPLVFFKKRPWLSAISLYLAGYLIVRLEPTVFDYVMHLYKIHIIAFPLGVLAAWGVTKLKSPELLERLAHGWRAVGYYLVMAGLLVLFIYANYNSGIGGTPNKEQWMSIIAVVTISLIFILKKIEFKIFYWFGLYSYEIYLWHWPIMYRFDIFYSWLPAWLATLLYLVFFVGLGWGAAKLTDYFIKRPPAPTMIK